MYKNHLIEKGQKPKTCRTKLSRVLVFLRFLEKNESDLLKLDFQTIEMFYQYMSTKYNKTAQANIKYTIRGFLKWGEQTQIVPEGAAKMIGAIYGNKHERLPSTYTQEELQRILLAIDRSSIIGKRDYAMMVLLIQLGMRRSDICQLTLDSIRPEDNTIVFEQQKTGSHEKLPMTKSIRLGLADYLKNSRPETQSNRLFVVLEGVGKGEPSADTIVYTVLNRYMKKAGIVIEGKRHGSHSIRHSLSSSLLKSGVGLPVISRILGHSSSEITKRYLWMDTEQLRNFSLEVPYAD
jgi:site-specific recombinase XerD